MHQIIMLLYVILHFVEMNAKGVILKAFDQYRLKTCIDFSPWKGEENYISVFKGNGWVRLQPSGSLLKKLR